MSHEETTPVDAGDPAGTDPGTDPGTPRRTTWRRRASALGSVQRTAALVPIAVLSLAWTASLTGVSLSDAAVSGLQLPAVVAPASPPAVPSRAISAPASVSTTPAVGSPTPTVGNVTTAADTDAGQIPSVALAAYQRAQTVIDTADPTCHLSWQLLAAIGDVESDHGRAHGSVLAPDGVVHPSIYGVRLKIADTDGGLIDGETGYDRAVGPMQFIPSTWQAVAVDADNDGVRNPQDINDAALGAAVYLCSGTGDLATPVGQQAAVYRYNHSASYVSLVLAIERAYMSGDYLASPDSTAATGYLTPSIGGDLTSTKHRHTRHHRAPSVSATPAPSDPGTTTTPSTPSGTGKGGGKGDGGNQSGNGNSTGKGGGKTPSPGKPDIPRVPGVPTPQVPSIPKTGVKPVDKLLTKAQAVVQCTLDGYVDNILVSNDKFDVCVEDYMTTGKGPTQQ